MSKFSDSSVTNEYGQGYLSIQDFKQKNCSETNIDLACVCRAFIKPAPTTLDPPTLHPSPTAPEPSPATPGSDCLALQPTGPQQ